MSDTQRGLNASKIGDKEHHSLYKSKSGMHFKSVSHRDRIIEEKKKNRNNDRHAAFAAQRIIEKTPNKPIPCAPATTDQSNVTKNKSTLDRQKAFMEKFKRYRDKKAKEQQEKKRLSVAPFVSAVPSGRIVSVKPARVAAAVKMTVPRQIQLMKGTVVLTPRTKNSKFVRKSPINTRSKKLALLSPSQLPTPTRKKKQKSIIANGVTIKVRKVFATTAAKGRTATSNVPTATKATNAKKSIARTTVPATLVQKGKPKITAATSRRTGPATKPTKPTKATKAATAAGQPVSEPFKITEIPPIPSKFDFTTSTVVKPRKSSIVPIRSRSTSVQLFNESISPIENGTPKASKRSSILVKRTPKVVDVIATTPLNKEPVVEEAPVTPVSKESAANTSVNYVSPFVTISRGKHHASKEREARETMYNLSSRKSIDLNESIEMRQNKEAASYFRMIVRDQTDHLLALVDNWQAKKETDRDSLLADHIDSIDVAIGQTRLLISGKFKQFLGLVDKCEAGDGQPPVRPEDLEGFWGSVYKQVENIQARFDRLNEVEEHKEEVPVLAQPKIKKIKKNLAITKHKAKNSRPNGMLAQMLKEARKKVKESKENGTSKINLDNQSMFSMSRRRSSLINRDLNNSVTRSSGTPRKSAIWIVSARNDENMGEHFVA